MKRSPHGQTSKPYFGDGSILDTIIAVLFPQPTGNLED